MKCDTHGCLDQFNHQLSQLLCVSFFVSHRNLAESVQDVGKQPHTGDLNPFLTKNIKIRLYPSNTRSGMCNSRRATPMIPPNRQINRSPINFFFIIIGSCNQCLDFKRAIFRLSVGLLHGYNWKSSSTFAILDLNQINTIGLKTNT